LLPELANLWQLKYYCFLFSSPSLSNENLPSILDLEWDEMGTLERMLVLRNFPHSVIQRNML
jgi:hypothetical protein